MYDVRHTGRARLFRPLSTLPSLGENRCEWCGYDDDNDDGDDDADDEGDDDCDDDGEEDDDDDDVGDDDVGDDDDNES